MKHQHYKENNMEQQLTDTQSLLYVIYNYLKNNGLLEDFKEYAGITQEEASE